MITFAMKCRKCGRVFECDGHCANLSGFWEKESWCKMPDKEKEEQQKRRSSWVHPFNGKEDQDLCTCDDCKNRLVDENGKRIDTHCEPREIKVMFD
jgi:hypothetical protein